MRQIAAGAQTVPATLLEHPRNPFTMQPRALFPLHQAIADLGHPSAGCWHYTPEEGKNERQSHDDWARSD